MYKKSRFCLFFLFAVLCTLGLSSCSCVLQTHQLALDMAKVYDATVILHDAV